MVKLEKNRQSEKISCAGQTAYAIKKQKNIKIAEDTFFDLASLTKPLATLPALLILLREGKITLEASVEELLEYNLPPDKKKITLWDILCHRSGLAAYHPFFSRIAGHDPQATKEEVRDIILKKPLVYPPGSRSLYSDLGFILAGWIVEKQSGETLDTFASRWLYQPLGIAEKIFFNPAGRILPGTYAEGEYCPWRGRLLRGEVGDENCALLGGVAGHAGLFGSITGVTELLGKLLNLGWGDAAATAAVEEKIKIRSDDLRRCARRWDESGANTWAGGFDSPTPGASSGGSYLSPESIGHLGFAGPSFWLDPRRRLLLILLNNRVHPCRSNEKIKKFRPRYHDAIMTALGFDREISVRQGL